MTTSEQSGYQRATLAPTQIKVLRCIAQGYTDEEISAQLDVKRSTVRAHLREITRRLDIRRRTLLVVYALKAHVISLDEIELPGYHRADVVESVPVPPLVSEWSVAGEISDGPWREFAPTRRVQ